MGGEVLPDQVDVAAVTTEVVGVTRYRVLWGQDNVGACDTEAVGEGFSSRYSIAGATLELVSHRMHALRELFDSGVKTVWKSPKLLVFISLVNMLLILRNVSA